MTVAAIQFAVETLEQVRSNRLEQLLERHYRELASFPDVPLGPDWVAYSRVEAIGALRIFTARVAGELVGYAAYFVNRNPHWPLMQAQQDVFFIDPEHRGARIGPQLITFAESMLSGEGVGLVVQRSKIRPGPDSTVRDIGPLLKRLGYAPVETAWAKRLDKGRD